MSKVKYSWHVLAVQDLKRSAEYFMDTLGFEEVFRTPGGKSFLKLDDFRVMLGECPNELPASTTGDHSHFAYVVCEDVDAYYDGFVKRGALITSPVADKPWKMREFNLETPNGHRMVFGQELP